MWLVDEGGDIMLQGYHFFARDLNVTSKTIV